MEKKNIKDWVTEIASEPSDFTERFRSDPATILEKRGFHLHESYKERLGNLTDEQKEAIARAFDQIANADSPQELRQIYSEWASQYELLFGWEGLQEEGPRGWTGQM